MDDWISQCNAYVITYMITSQDSFDFIKDLIPRVETIKRSKTIPMIIIGRFQVNKGNKKDMVDRKVSESEAQAYAASHNIKFLETSAKTGDNVSNAFDLLTEEYLRIRKELQEESMQKVDRGAGRESCKCNLI